MHRFSRICRFLCVGIFFLVPVLFLIVSHGQAAPTGIGKVFSSADDYLQKGKKQKDRQVPEGNDEDVPASIARLDQTIREININNRLITMGTSALTVFIAPFVQEHVAYYYAYYWGRKLQYTEIKTDDSLGISVILNRDVQKKISKAIAVLGNGYIGKFPLPNILLYGPPGTGKTLLAKKIALSRGFKMFEMSASAWFALSTPEAIAQMDRFFDSLDISREPILVFIDEAEPLLMNRAKMDNNEAKILAHFLAKTGKLRKNSAFIFATNRGDILDAAIKSRFTFIIEINLPDKAARKRLVTEYFLTSVSRFLVLIADPATAQAYHHMSEEVLKAIQQWLLFNDGQLAEATEGFSGRDFYQASIKIEYGLLSLESELTLPLFQSMLDDIIRDIRSSKKTLDSGL